MRKSFLKAAFSEGVPVVAIEEAADDVAELAVCRAVQPDNSDAANRQAGTNDNNLFMGMMRG
jgi:hypothetical protein